MEKDLLWEIGKKEELCLKKKYITFIKNDNFLMFMKTCIIIPARLASTRLPEKVIADINGKPMIAHIYEACLKANCGDVFVATDNEKVKEIIESLGGRAVLTNPDLPSGTDRVHAALSIIDPKRTIYSRVINVQGDVPNIMASVISETNKLMDKIDADITTPVVLISDEAKKNKSSVVKPILSFKEKDYARALYFTRATSPYGEGPLYEHIGVYVYTRNAIEKFVSLSPSTLEKRESLEQLRALENDMKIYAQVVEHAPISVDIPEDLEMARKIMK
jgi:3-deoxy-manno-octulosonate cytidylyltransferase (CMP-KDO synthetase)